MTLWDRQQFALHRNNKVLMVYKVGQVWFRTDPVAGVQ
jgi:hypothetical protein